MADGKQLPCKGLPPHGKPWGFRPRNEEGFIMTKTDKLNIMRNRKTVLMARGKENGKIVAKINRKIKKLEK